MKLKTLYHDPQKTINYHGMTFQVPEWACFIAVDSDGDVYVYSDEPHIIDGRTYWAYAPGTPVDHIGEVILETTDEWKSSLQAI